MDSLSDNSFMIGPFGDSKMPYDMCGTMLAHALQAEESKKTEILNSTICLIVDMLVDGIIIDLEVKNKWSRAQGKLADVILLSFTKQAQKYVINIFNDKSRSGKGWDDGPLAFAILFFWALRDKASACVEENLNLAKKQHSITKHRPPANLG